MFGNNPKRQLETNLPGRTLRVHSIFATIQGEGPFAGMPCVFIRLAGCNLACHFCDTPFDEHWDQPQTIEHIVKNVSTVCGEERQHLRRLVVITGGEPLIQNIGPLVQALWESGTHTVQIETAGTAWPDSLNALMEVGPGDLHIVCSPKTPKVHPRIMEYCTDYKYILADGEMTPEDGLPIRGTQSKSAELQRLYRPDLADPAITVWVQPRDDQDAEKNKKNLEVCVWSAMQFGYSISIQTHKIMGVE